MNFSKINLIAHVPIGDPNVKIHQFGTIQSLMSKSNNLSNTGYSIYTGSLSVTWNSTVLPPVFTYDVVAVKDEVSVEKTFFLWEALAFCNSTT